MNLRAHLLKGHVIPAHPLALTRERRLDECRQRALTRYYLDAGAGGIAVGVHTTQFEIRERGMYGPVLELAAESAGSWLAGAPRDLALVAGLCGNTKQAVSEAQIARNHGFQAGLLSLGALKSEPEPELLEHCRIVAESIPLFGFYLQPAVGGRLLSYRFWREFVEIPQVVAVKIAAFNRYQTLDVIRAVSDSGRDDDIALYTGNDDNIVADLLTTFQVGSRAEPRQIRIVGGLLGQWAVWTAAAVDALESAKTAAGVELSDANARSRSFIPLLSYGSQLTDANSAIFDTANGFSGCIPGIHEILRRQGLLLGTWCLNPREQLSPGQSEEIDRILRVYPHLTDDEFVRRNLDRWLS